MSKRVWIVFFVIYGGNYLWLSTARAAALGGADDLVQRAEKICLRASEIKALGKALRSQICAGRKALRDSSNAVDVEIVRSAFYVCEVFAIQAEDAQDCAVGEMVRQVQSNGALCVKNEELHKKNRDLKDALEFTETERNAVFGVSVALAALACEGGCCVVQ